MTKQIIAFKWSLPFNKDKQDILFNKICSERKIPYISFDNGFFLKLDKFDILFKKFKLYPSKFKIRTYYLSNDDMLIYRIKKEEHPFVSVSIINSYKDYKYVISFFSRLNNELHEKCVQYIFQRENYAYSKENHLFNIDNICNNSILINYTIKGDTSEDIENEGNYLINLLEL